MYQDGTYFSNNPTWGEEDAEYKAQRVIDTIVKNGLVFKSLCDVGCGTGGILLELAKKFGDEITYVGYDISPQVHEINKQREQSNIRFHLGDVLEDDDAFYDLILANDVFEHVEDSYGFLRKLQPRAKYKIFHIPLDLSARTVMRVQPLLDARKNVGHIHYYTKELAIATLRDTGYEVLDWSYTTKVIEQKTTSARATILKILNKTAYSISPDMAVRLFGGYSMMVLTK